MGDILFTQRRITHKKRTRALISGLALGCLLISGPLQADITEQRQAFLEAEQLAKNGKLNADDPRVLALKDYPLYPYLEFYRLSALDSGLTPSVVNRFSQQFPDSHLEGLLRYRLTQQLGAKKHWDNYITSYNQLDNPSTEMQCLFIEAQLAAGDHQSGLALATKLWQEGHSQPDECDPGFEQLIKEKAISSDIALSRVLNALDEGNSGLAKYASRFIVKADAKSIANKAQAIYSDPDQILSLSQTPGNLKPYLARIQHIAIRRAYRSSFNKAYDLLIALGDRLILSQANTSLLQRVGIRIAKDLNPEDEKRLARLDSGFTAPELTEWRIRLALYEQDWKRALVYIGKLPSEMQNEGRWHYWHSIADSRIQLQTPDFGTLPAERSFYGFMSAERSGQSYQLNQQSPRFTDEIYQPLSDSVQMARIKELIALDRYQVARSEWNQWKTALDSQGRQAVAHLMRDMDWYQQGIITAAYEGLWNDLQLRFPTVYMDHFSKHASKQNIDPIWALAISRQESALFPWARSSVGARGLMQLMPRTAKHTAKLIGIRYPGTDSLYDPAVNIRLGTAYLSEMYQKFDGNRVYASAAYNAGPHRVTRWLQQGHSLPLDIWIETIPFDETRNYVQNVLSFALIYGEMNGQRRKLFNEQEQAQFRVAMR